MFKKYFVPILQTMLLVMAISVSYSYSFSNDEIDEAAGYVCPAAYGCESSGCTGSRFFKSCTYTPINGASCPDKTQCGYRF